MNISTDTRRIINNLDRAQIEKILASYGYQVYDHESTDDLRATILSDVASGVIDSTDLDIEPNHLMDCRDR